MTIKDITTSALSIALEVNAVLICNCGHHLFKVGLVVDQKTENNFIRIFECGSCGYQMPSVHKSDSGLVPTVAADLRKKQ